LSRNPPEISTYSMLSAIPMIKPVEQLQGTDIRKVNDDIRDSLMQICPASLDPFSNQDEILNDSSNVGRNDHL